MTLNALALFGTVFVLLCGYALLADRAAEAMAILIHNHNSRRSRGR